nr:putative disease resistance protein RGA1 [Malus domestica]XP_028943983.1 putative disease resistance protein RGA1 [Malus domestica]XP_028943985.1 putative disease resistance protein RGA1 [Malus domestica]
MSKTYNLKTFPREMENLINLRHVYFNKDKEFPFRITQLTHLQALRSFTLDRARRHTIDELGGLNEVKGELVIGSLEYVRDKKEAMKSNLVGKTHIRKLELKWKRSHYTERNGNFLDQDILEGLQSPPNLESLRIVKFMGAKFASCMMSDSLTEIQLSNCKKCEEVPPLGHLRKLQSIDIVDCPNLKSIPISSSQSLERLYIALCPKLRCTSIHSLSSLRHLQIENSVDFSPEADGEDDLSLNGCTSLCYLFIKECNGFKSILNGLQSCTSLRTLIIWNCRNLRTLSGHGLQTPVSLEGLSIFNCPRLEAIPSLDNLTFLTELKIRKCGRLTSIPSGLASCTSLTSLSVDDCRNLISLADHNLSSLQSLSSLSVSNCGKLQYLPKGLHSLSRLKRLWIGKFCKELDSFPDLQVPSEKLILYGWPKLKSLPQPIQHSTSLTSLSIKYFHGVEALPEWLGNLTSLTELEIWKCKNLMHLPTVEAMQRLTKLRKLQIRWCPRLKERCAKDGPEWPKIYHIPVIRVNGILVE